MSRYRELLLPLSVLFVCLAPSTAYGQATRTWVSGVGSDANPCSRTAPCKTFAGAIASTAAGGEIDVLDPGGFGAVTITKSISIESAGVIAGVLVSGTNGIVINAGPTDVVVLRGLTINGIGTGLKGIDIISAGVVIIEDCFVAQFTPRGISIEPAMANVKVSISNSKIQASASNGIVVQPANGIQAQVTLDNVDIIDSTNFGLSVTAGSSVIIRNSTIADNGLANIRADGTGGAATIELDNVIVGGSTTGILSVGGATVRVNGSTITDNVTGLSLSGGTILSFGNNRLSGNGTNGSFSGMVGLQ
jgi:hypothetical protein